MSDMRAVALDDDGFDDPPPYKETTESTGQREKTGFSREYLFSVPAALKLIQIILSLIGFIATLAAGYGGSGFVAWVTISAFLTTTILFLLQALSIISRLPGFWPLYELIYLILYTLKYMIATIVAGVDAARSSSIMAACVICGVAFLIYLLDGIMAYKRFQEARQKLEEQRASGEGVGQRRGGNSFCIIF